jgi:NADPH2:quinone reductase
VVDAKAIGVNYPGRAAGAGLYQMKPETPFIPGMEAAGVVESVGANVTHVKPGDRVVVMLDHGAYAEKVLAPANRVFPTARRNAFDRRLRPDVRLGHLASRVTPARRVEAGRNTAGSGRAGSTGLAAISIGKAIGARVIAVASTAEKRAACLDAGADCALPYDGLREALKSQTVGRGVDVAFDPVGGDAFDVAARAMARNGRLLVVGFASGTIPKLPSIWRCSRNSR